MKIEQFVIAYKAEQDRLRALLPDGFSSLRPVLRINAEIHDGKTACLEFNTPVECEGKKGWLNISVWNNADFEKTDKTAVFTLPFLKISFVKVGITGGCPAEKDNDGCFFLGDGGYFRPYEQINENKEFCDCEFKWSFSENDAGGKSEGKTIPAFAEPITAVYERRELSAENAAAIPCEQVLGAYTVCFER